MPRKQAAFGQPAVYNATPPSLVDGDLSALNVDSTGALIVVGGTGGGGGGVSAKYNVTPPIYTDGATAILQTDVNGNLKTVILDAIAPTSANLTAADAGSTVGTGFNGSSVITGTPTAGSFLEISFNGENAVAIQLTGTWVASVSFERSIDNGATYHPASVISSGQNYSSVTGNGLFFINAAGANKARVRVPAGSFTSGSIAASLYAATGIFPISLVSAVSGMYNATAPTLNDKGVAALQLDVNGNQKQNMVTRLDPVNDAVTSYDFGHSFQQITTATTTNLKSGAGVLKRLIVQGGTTGTIAIYDNTAASGTKIADFDTTNAIAVYDFDAAFTIGLTIVTSAATKITPIWR